jgi:hypothetical protein
VASTGEESLGQSDLCFPEAYTECIAVPTTEPEVKPAPAEFVQSEPEPPYPEAVPPPFNPVELPPLNGPY